MTASLSRPEPGVLTSRESLVFHGITAAGTLQPRELFRFMEKTGPQWWLPASGLPRHEFWRRAGRTLVARHTTIRILADDCHASDPVLVEHVIRHGRRNRSLGRPPEYGFVDVLRVRRESDGAELSDLTVDSVWLELAAGAPQVATTPPAGLNCPVEELPEIEPPPRLGEPVDICEYRWTWRETDGNGHVSFPCYVERAENALADLNHPQVTRPVWQGWYRQESFADERMRLAVQRVGDGYVFGFAGADERRPRVTVRLDGLAGQPPAAGSAAAMRSR